MPVWMLGARDREMAEIEAVLEGVGEEVLLAAKWLSRWDRLVRVNAREAYGFSLVGDVSLREVKWEEVKRRAVRAGGLVLVECEPPWWAELEDELAREGVKLLRADHHREGDPGWDVEPSRYWEGSSLGQVVEMLRGWGKLSGEVRSEWRLVAAADHCLGAAYRGECPGVDVVRLRKFRLEERARFLMAQPERAPARRAVERYLPHGERGLPGWRRAVQRALDEAGGQIAAAPRVTLGGWPVADIREEGIIAEAPEASARMGLPILYRSFLRGAGAGAGGVGLLNARRETVEAWISGEGVAGEYRERKGNPGRGMAWGKEQG